MCTTQTVEAYVPSVLLIHGCISVVETLLRPSCAPMTTSTFSPYTPLSPPLQSLTLSLQAAYNGALFLCPLPRQRIFPVNYSLVRTGFVPALDQMEQMEFSENFGNRQPSTHLFEQDCGSSKVCGICDITSFILGDYVQSSSSCEQPVFRSQRLGNIVCGGIVTRSC